MLLLPSSYRAADSALHLRFSLSVFVPCAKISSISQDSEAKFHEQNPFNAARTFRVGELDRQEDLRPIDDNTVFIFG